MWKSNVKFGKMSLFVDEDKLLVKVGRKGQVYSAPDFFASYPRGEARQIRKNLRAGGFVKLASVKRTPLPF